MAQFAGAVILKAEMDLRARYRSDTAPYALVALGNTMMDAERNRLQQPLPFDVLIDITGSMSGPDIGVRYRCSSDRCATVSPR